MAKKKNEENITVIKKLIGSDKLIIGTDRTLKAIKQGTVKKVYTAKNCPEDTLAKIERYSGISEIEIIPLEYPNEDLGTLCKKPFAVSVISVAKE